MSILPTVKANDTDDITRPSLRTPMIIARVRVAFHFHPMVYYEGWQKDYADVASRLINTFDSGDVSFLSMGSVTLTKPVIKKIRDLGNPTRILQMEFVTDPHGKLTYPDDVKVDMFGTMHKALAPWHDDVFMYLCMEKAEIWERVWGRVYATNEEFEQDLARRTSEKMATSKGSHASHVDPVVALRDE